MKLAATLIALFALAGLPVTLPLLSKDLPAAFPLNGATQVLDNERVTAWDYTGAKGARTTMSTRHPLDMVTIDIAGASVKATAANSNETASFKVGQVSFKKKDAAAGNQAAEFTEETTSNTARRTIYIDLKDATIQPIKNTSKYPEAFPRDGAKKLFENDRVIVWDYTWKMGKPTPMHFHTLDTVTVALEAGEVKSTPVEGEATINTSTFARVRFNPRGRIHTEELVKGAAHAIIVELK